MNTILKLFQAAISAARRERSRRFALEQLDAHTLRDIGFEQEAESARRRSLRQPLHLSVHG